MQFDVRVTNGILFTKTWINFIRKVRYLLVYTDVMNGNEATDF